MEFEGSIKFSIIEQTKDKVVGEMPIHFGIKNPYGVVHLGAMQWFADVCATVLVLGSPNAREGQKGFPLAINLAGNFISNQSAGTFKAVSTFVKRGKAMSAIRSPATSLAYFSGSSSFPRTSRMELAQERISVPSRKFPPKDPERP